MLKKGDKYIHHTKYGGINRGVVKECIEVQCTDLVNKCIYSIQHIITTNNITLFLDGRDGQIYRVDREFEDEDVDKLTKLYNNLKKK